MSLQIVVGAQWGDEGKGRIVDWLASGADFNARYNGGDNAGHTVTVGKHIFKLHLIPSGIIHPGLVAVLGSGMVVNPHTLFDEMDELNRAGITTAPDRLRISFAAHLITPAHQALDKAQETARGKASLGTTGRGIGPAYTDKTARRGLRVADMLAEDFCDRVGDHVAETNLSLSRYGAPRLDPSLICSQYREYAERLKPHIGDISTELASALKAGKTVLVEAAQGTLLDLDFGTYPFVTSSSTTAPAALTGLGLGLEAAENASVIGVVKAFQTRVGTGPFPTELSGGLAGRLRGSGANPWDEFGTTTGRPRRVGWLDGVLLRYAVRLNGLNALVLTKLDILTGLETIPLCTAYRREGKTYTDLPLGLSNLGTYEPVYEELKGWKEDLGAVRRWKDLPAAARGYLERVEALAAIPLRLVSVGPEREQIIERD